jgi:hypothetical protein
VARRGRALRPPLNPPADPRGTDDPLGTDTAGATVETFAELAARVLAVPVAGRRIVAVDGRGAAGKSTFAARLARALGDVPVVHTDDYAGRAGRGWWALLEEEFLGPAPPGTYVLEGVSSSRRAITDRLAYAVWMHVPTGPRLARGIARDGPAAAADWARYEAEENAFLAADPAADRADIVVDGAPALPHDPEREYVRLR